MQRFGTQFFDVAASYCDPNDQCCAKPDPEIPHLPRTYQSQFQKRCPPKNLHQLENSILHRLNLKQKLQQLVELQDKGLFKEDDTPPPLHPSVNPSEAHFRQNPDQFPSPPTQSEQAPSSSDGIWNTTLIHEIALNKDFQFENMDKSINKHAQISNELKDKYWQKVEQALIKSRPNQSEVKDIILGLITTLKKMLHDTILPHNLTMRLRIDRMLNLKKITEEIKKNAFDFEKYINFILDSLAVLCCPIHDNEIVEIRKLISDKAPISKPIQRTVSLMQAMNLDTSNFVLAQSRGQLIQNCINYERQQFSKYMQTEYQQGRDPILFTRHWILSHCIPGRGFEETMSYAYLEILEKDDNDTNWPETLALDWSRFAPIRHEIQRITIVGAMASSIYDYTLSLVNSLENPRNYEEIQVWLMKNLAFLRKLRDKLNLLLESKIMLEFDKLYQALSECCIKAVQEVNGYLHIEHCVTLYETQKDTITAIILSLIDLNHPARQLCYRRIKKWFLQEMQTEGKSIVQVPPNLHVVAPFIQKPITEVLKIFTYNRAVFDVMYKEIFLGKCIAPSVFPPKATIILDANNPQSYYSPPILDPGIANLVQKLDSLNDRTVVYRKSRINPQTQPWFNPDTGQEILPPEKQKVPIAEKLSPSKQRRYDQFLLDHESTLDVDYEGIYDPNITAADPAWMLNQNSEQLIRLMERENIINANKLKRIKKRMKEEALRKVIESNLPAFEKVWREEVGHLQQEFCRLERIKKKGEVKLPANAEDAPKSKHVFHGACRKKDTNEVKKPIPPRCNEKGERIMYSKNRGAKFAVKEIPPVNADGDKLKVDDHFFSMIKPDPEDEVTVEWRSKYLDGYAATKPFYHY